MHWLDSLLRISDKRKVLFFWFPQNIQPASPHKSAFLYLETTHGYFRTSARGVATLAGNAFTHAHATDAPDVRRARAAVLSHVSVFILISFSVSAVAETKAAAWLHYTGLQRIIYMPRTRLYVVFGPSFTFTSCNSVNWACSCLRDDRLLSVE